MDKRLPHRVEEIQQKLSSEKKTCDADTICDALRRAHPEYSRMKRQPLRRLIVQQLSNSAPSTKESLEPEAEESDNKKRKKGDDPPDEPDGEGSLNGSLRKMYQPDSTQDSKNSGARQPEAVAKRQKASMDNARRSAGLSAPQGAEFTPEDRPDERLEDLGGIDKIVDELRQLIVWPLTHPEVFSHLGVQPPIGVLLHGPPGSGKTKLAAALAGTIGVPYFKVAATEIVSGMSGESEAKIRTLFQAAISAAPSLMFLDEVDAITPKRDTAGREMERRIVAQLLTCLDELQNKNVLVLAATNRPDALDPALRRAGRFDREIAIGIPDEKARKRILEKMTESMRLAEDLDLALLAKLTPGYVGADLFSLTKEAALDAVSRCFSDLGGNGRRCGETEDDKPSPFSQEEMKDLAVNMADFHAALGRVQPSAKREGFTTVPEVNFQDVGALDNVITELDAAVCEPIRKADLFKSLGLTVPCGVLLFGPPGCGKTLLAKAAANASGANFIAVKGPELLNKYVGESERGVRLVFQRAQASSPCVIFFDELDALVPKRSSEGTSSAERVVNQMLTELDGVQSRAQVFVMAATNRPDLIDPAMLRPGRLDKMLFVPLPKEIGRLEILQKSSQKLPLTPDCDLKAIAKTTEGFSGADLSGLVREAAMLAIRAASAAVVSSGDPSATTGDPSATIAVPEVSVSNALLQEARRRMVPSVGKAERREYEELALKLCGRAALGLEPVRKKDDICDEQANAVSGDGKT